MMMLWWCYDDVLMWWWCYDYVMMLWWCYGDVMMSWWCVMMVLWLCYDVMMMLWWCHDDVMMMLWWWCYYDVMMMLWWCYGDVKMMLWWRYDYVMMLWWCYDDGHHDDAMIYPSFNYRIFSPNTNTNTAINQWFGTLTEKNLPNTNITGDCLHSLTSYYIANSYRKHFFKQHERSVRPQSKGTGGYSREWPRITTKKKTQRGVLYRSLGLLAYPARTYIYKNKK